MPLAIDLSLNSYCVSMCSVEALRKDSIGALPEQKGAAHMLL